MSYSEQAKAAKAAGKTKRAQAGTVKLDAEHPEVIGIVVGVKQMTFKGLGKPSTVAVLDTDEGEALVLAGTVLTNYCEKPENKGKLIIVSYVGKAYEGEPGEYNMYDIEEVLF